MGARNWSRVEEQEDRTFRIGSPNMREPVGKQQGLLDKGCTGLGELHWAFKKGFPRRVVHPETSLLPLSVPAPIMLPKETQKWSTWGPTWEDGV